jgi:hypothetical protein
VPQIVELEGLDADFIYARRGERLLLIVRASLDDTQKARIVAAVSAGRSPSLAA